MNKLGKVITVFLEKLFDLAALFVSGTVNCVQKGKAQPLSHNMQFIHQNYLLKKRIDFVRYTCVKQLVTRTWIKCNIYTVYNNLLP